MGQHRLHFTLYMQWCRLAGLKLRPQYGMCPVGVSLTSTVLVDAFLQSFQCSFNGMQRAQLDKLQDQADTRTSAGEAGRADSPTAPPLPWQWRHIGWGQATTLRCSLKHYRQWQRHARLPGYLCRWKERCGCQVMLTATQPEEVEGCSWQLVGRGYFQVPTALPWQSSHCSYRTLTPFSQICLTRSCQRWPTAGHTNAKAEVLEMRVTGHMRRECPLMEVGQVFHVIGVPRVTYSVRVSCQALVDSGCMQTFLLSQQF